MSSSSAFVSDRLGSLSYHKSDHPTLNAAAALGPTRANQLPVALGLSVQTLVQTNARDLRKVSLS